MQNLSLKRSLCGTSSSIQSTAEPSQVAKNLTQYFSMV
jgi:hypothetical protein